MLWCPCEFPAGDDDYCDFHQHEPFNCDCYFEDGDVESRRGE